MLLVEQHVHLALGIADQAYVMTHGELQISGAASTILSQLDSLEASYLGRSESRATATTGETSACSQLRISAGARSGANISRPRASPRARARRTAA